MEDAAARWMLLELKSKTDHLVLRLNVYSISNQNLEHNRIETKAHCVGDDNISKLAEN